LKLIVLIALIFKCISIVWASPKWTNNLIWKAEGKTIEGIKFSKNGSFVGFSSQVYWPDGHMAESFSKSYFDKLKKSQENDPRFADPIIYLVNMKGELKCSIKYGWKPEINSDGRIVYYTFQKNPISGKRRLAETLKGNEIHFFDCSKKQDIILSKPQSGYLDDAKLINNDQEVLFSINKPVNGAYGGSVGISSYSLKTQTERIKISQKDIKAIPCPKDTSILSKHQNMLCGNPDIAKKFPVLLGNVSKVDDAFYSLIHEPIPKVGDFYQASNYNNSLVNISSAKVEIKNLGEKSNVRSIFFQGTDKSALFLFDTKWKQYEKTNNKWLLKKELKYAKPSSKFSRDLKYYIFNEEDSVSQNATLSVYNTETGEKVYSAPKALAFYDFEWSEDSKKIAYSALVSTGADYREELRIISLE